MNQFKIDYDFPGLCAKCHEEIAEFSGSHPNGTPIITRLLPNYELVTFTLDDNSNMKVALCKDCKVNLVPDDCQEIMESVINGWAWEIERAKWPNDKQEKYMAKYQERYIIDRYDMLYDDKDKGKIKKPRPDKLKKKAKKEK